MHQLHLWEKEKIRKVRLDSKHPDWSSFLKDISNLLEGKLCCENFCLTRKILRRKKYEFIDKKRTLDYIRYDLNITCDCGLANA